MIGFALPNSHTNAVQHHEAAHHAVDSLFLFSLWERYNQLGTLRTKGFQFRSSAICRGVCFLLLFFRRNHGQLGFRASKHSRVPVLQRT
jgi:hypothetical protein